MANPHTNVVAVARSEKDLKALESRFGGRVKAIVGDVADPEVSKSAVAAALAFGSVDAVIANAGVLEPVAPLKDASTDDWQRAFGINVFAVVELIVQTLPHLRKSKGNVVAVLLGASTTAYVGWGAYGASKAALNHVILTLDKEEKDVNAILVAPGVVDTDMQLNIRAVHGANMGVSLEKFVNLHKNNELLDAAVPAAVYSRLAVSGWPKDLNGSYLRFNDERLN